MTERPTPKGRQTRERLLAAATAQFAEHGIAGTRMEAIAREARANKERLYSNFGSKSELFADVLAERMSELAAAVRMNPVDVPECLGQIFDFHRANPDLIRLLHWEGLEGQPPWTHYQTRADHYADKAAVVAQASDTEDPEGMLVALLAVATWWFVVPQIVEMILGEDPTTPKSRARQRSIVVETAGRMIARA